MKANFSFIYPGDHRDPEIDADNHADWLAQHQLVKFEFSGKVRNLRDDDNPPEKFKNYYLVDVLGKEFVWMNDSFPKDRYKWYLWYESVFLVPEEMATFLILRWS